MKIRSQKRKIQWKQYTGIAIFVALGLVCGTILGMQMNSLHPEQSGISESLLFFALTILIMVASLMIQIVIHEGGHLVFGLLTGYQFQSFRIGSFMWIKEGRHLRHKRLSIAGTGGQCLMVPPDLIDGKIPYTLYNMGGSLFNLMSGVVFILAYINFNDVPYLSTAFLLPAVIGMAFALINGIPLRFGTIDNDGYNALSLGKNPAALRSFWVQMKINEQISEGVRLKDMPDEWFTVPTQQEMKNSMTAAIGVFACNRLMDAHQFTQADRLMRSMLQTNTAMVGLYRHLLICDRIYCELIGENRKEVIDGLLDENQKRMMKSMKEFPSILRTEYALACLALNDKEIAKSILTQFEKRARTYPYASDIQSEQELIELADRACET